MASNSVSRTASAGARAEASQADIAELMSEPTVNVGLAGRVLKISRNTIYKAVRNGEIPTVRIGAQYRVPSAKLREMLGIKPEPIAA